MTCVLTELRLHPRAVKIPFQVSSVIFAGKIGSLLPSYIIHFYASHQADTGRRITLVRVEPAASEAAPISTHISTSIGASNILRSENVIE